MAFWRQAGRSTRNTCTPIISTLIFVILLSILFILYQPTRGPGRYLQRIGWQSFGFVQENSALLPQGPLPIDPGSIGGTVGTENGGLSSLPPDVDWWDVENAAATENATSSWSSISLPMDKWNPLLPHDTGLTDIAITRCIIPAYLTHVCSPQTTPEEDALKGPWVRVERDLDKNDGMWFLNIYYRRSRRLDIPLINNITLLPKDIEPNTDADSWQKVPISIRDGVIGATPLFLWYHLGPPLRELSGPADKNKLVTELDVLFGESKPFWGFERLETPINEGKEGKLDPVWLTYRRGVTVPPKAPPLHFSRNGTFKIMQVADLHYSVSPGHCRDTDLSPCRKGDYQTESLLSRALDSEKPDLVVFTGDQLNGQDSSWDARSVIAKFTDIVIQRKLPWCAIFGNHDDENDLGRESQMKLLEWLPYSLSSAGPKDVDGVGNYVLKVRSADASKTQLLTLYMLDSHAYTTKRLPGIWGWFQKLKYDWIKQSQIDWFLAESAAIKPIIRPFTPDGGKDLGKVWKRQESSEASANYSIAEGPANERLAKPNAMVFFHIPLPEAYLPADIDPNSKKLLDVGSQIDDPGAADTNGGFFPLALMTALESEVGQRLSAGGNSEARKEVKVVGNGHCHISDNCRRISGIWMCFGGGGSYSGYGKVGFDRRFRVYDISDYGETIRTYKRTERNVIVDDMILTGRGALGEAGR